LTCRILDSWHQASVQITIDVGPLHSIASASDTEIQEMILSENSDQLRVLLMDKAPVPR